MNEDAITPEFALGQLLTVAAGVGEPDESAAVDRLLERLTSRPEPSQLRDALILVGAREVIRESRGHETPRGRVGLVSRGVIPKQPTAASSRGTYRKVTWPA